MAKRLNVLIGCEESGTVREAFRALGHNAYSCDLVAARDGSIYHVQDDVREVYKWGVPKTSRAHGHSYTGPHVGWDLVILHPPCTYLCNSGVRWFTTIPKIQQPGVCYGAARKAAMLDAADLFAWCLDVGKEGTPAAIENPVMHEHAKAAIWAALMHKYGWTDADARAAVEWDQTLQPWQFGDPQLKRTCFWLQNLKPLEIDPDEVLTPPPAHSEERKKWSRVHRESPGKDRAKIRSVSWPGMSRAMAWQWGGDARGGA